MVQFEDLQSLWQKQPARPGGPTQAIELTSAFRRYGRRNDVINCAKAIVIAGCVIFFVNQLRHRPLALFGACLTVFAALLFFISDWRKQRAIANLNFTSPSTDFLRTALARLEAQRDPFRTREFFVAMGGFWLGITIMMVSDWPKFATAGRVAGHVLITALPFGAFRLARWVRGKRFRAECLPLIERLTAVLNTIEGDRA
jgi:hypothetical protein